MSDYLIVFQYQKHGYIGNSIDNYSIYETIADRDRVLLDWDRNGLQLPNECFFQADAEKS